MFRNVFYDTRASKIHLWEQVKGENLYTEINWTPYVFVPCNEDQAMVKTIDGLNAVKKEFDSYTDYKNFSSAYSKAYENQANPAIQFLAERYYGISDDDIKPPKLKTYALDIEVNAEKFPHANEAEYPIVAISCCDISNGEITTFGIKPYTGDNPYNIRYICCDSEEELLNVFFHWWNNNCPDVVTGWNIVADNKMNRFGGFDLPYMINRCKNLFGEKTNVYKLFSPINTVRTYTSKDEETMFVDIAGVSVVDYLALYKWYTTKNLETYRLDYVAKVEVDEGKEDYSEYQDLRTLFKENWNLYVDYNAKDTLLLKNFEDKLGYLKLAQSLTLLCKCPMKMYSGATNLVEGLMLTRYRRHDQCAPRFSGGSQEGYDAAYVKDPIPGMYNWIFSLDITSSYPFATIALNMSPETLYGKILQMSENKIMECVYNRDFPEFKISTPNGTRMIEGKTLHAFNKGLERKLFSVAPNGSVFMNNPMGVYPEMQREVFLKRKEVKGRMFNVAKQIEMENDENKIKELKEEKARLHSFQWALKIVINSAYGVTAVPYSRYFNPYIAEAVTAVGRESLKSGERAVNELLNNPNEDIIKILEKINNGPVSKLDDRKSLDYVIYMDTDSNYNNFGMFRKQWITDEKWDNLTEEERVKTVDDVAKIVEDYVNNKVFNETQMKVYNSTVEDFKITYKQEKIARSGLFIRKKKYATWTILDEGVKKNSISITGLEIIRSETPSMFRDALKDLLDMIIKGANDKSVKDKYDEYKKIALTLRPEEVSANMGVNNIQKYINNNNQAAKGTPWHVKGVGNYRMLAEHLGISNKYPEVNEGEKAKVIYVKPNNFNIEAITYQYWPSEFSDAGIQPDYQRMIDKFFTKKVEYLLSPMGRDAVLKQNRFVNVFFK